MVNARKLTFKTTLSSGLLFFGLIGALVAATPTLAQDAEVIPPKPLFQNGWTEATIVSDQGDNYYDFLDQNFYGAFAMTADGYSYWYAGFHDLESARIATLAWCEDDSPAEGLPCELAAYLIPSEVPDDFVQGLGAAAQEEFKEFMTYGNEKAFALSANGSYAYTWDYGNSFEAGREAIKLCNESAENKADWVIGQSAGCVLYDYRDLVGGGGGSSEQLLQRPTKK